MSLPALLPRSKVKPTIVALLLGFFGALFAWFIGFPAPWLTGSALFVSVAGVAGVPVWLPNILRNMVFIVIGMTMGSGITPETVATAARWPFSILTLFGALIVIMFVGAKLLQRIQAYDRDTALLSAAPGHLSYVLTLSEDTKANVPVLSIVQTIRVLTLTLAVPFIIALIYPDLEPRYTFDGAAMRLSGLAVVAVIALFVGLILQKFRFPAALLMGGLLVSSLFHVTETITGITPTWLTIPAFTMMGVLIGTRFDGVNWPMLKGALSASMLTTATALIVAGAGALIVAQFIDVPPAHLLIAFAPGGLETMAAMGIILDANPAFIAAHHVLRIVFLTALIPLMLRFAKL